MTDKLTAEQRHLCMSHIRSKDTKPEMIVRKYLFAQGFRYRLHEKRLPGKPDIVMKKYHTVIFVNGCFWHGHEDCRYATMPKTRTDFWTSKIEHNRKRDKEDNAALKELGWNVLTVWECQLKTKVREQTLNEIRHWIDKSLLDIEAAKCKTKEYPLPDTQPLIAAEEKLPYKTK